MGKIQTHPGPTIFCIQSSFHIFCSSSNIQLSICEKILTWVKELSISDEKDQDFWQSDYKVKRQQLKATQKISSTIPLLLYIRTTNHKLTLCRDEYSPCVTIYWCSFHRGSTHLPTKKEIEKRTLADIICDLLRMFKYFSAKRQLREKTPLIF